MKSKVHQRKCFEMGIIPVPMTVDESQLDENMLVHHVEIQEDGKVTLSSQLTAVCVCVNVTMAMVA